MRRMYSKVIATSLSVLLLASCATKRVFKKEYAKVTPNPLELVGGQVPVDIAVTFPPKFIKKKATLVIRPLLKYDGGETYGPAFTYIGEKVLANDMMIPYKTGGQSAMNFDFLYRPEMLESRLYLTFDYRIGGKEVKVPEVMIANGVDATVNLATVASTTPAIAPDGFQRIMNQAYDADIMFLIQRTEVRSKELNKTDVQDWKDLVINAFETPNQKVNVEISSYASPDGGEKLNNQISRGREENTRKSIDAFLRKEKARSIEVNSRYTAQDWEGFKKLVETSNIQDKELILRVLEMYPDSEEREKQIRNLSSVFGDLAKEILPRLRRSRLIANIQIIGKSDDEILKLATSNPGKLKVDELLYATTLVSSVDQKTKFYQLATSLYPNDYRAFNNLGALAFEAGDFQKAMDFFNKANQLKPDNAETAMNFGLMKMMNNDLDGAMVEFGKAGNVREIGGALGLLYLRQGKYDQAVKAYDNTISTNAAVAHFLVKDYNGAIQILDKLPTQSATSYYLRSLVELRMNNSSKAMEYIRKATEESNRRGDNSGLLRIISKDINLKKLVTPNAEMK